MPDRAVAERDSVRRGPGRPFTAESNRAQALDPEWRRAQREGSAAANRRLATDPAWLAANAAAIGRRRRQIVLKTPLGTLMLTWLKRTHM
jgi:hypothetical protein